MSALRLGSSIWQHVPRTVAKTVPWTKGDPIQFRMHRPIEPDDIPQKGDGSPFPLFELYRQVQTASPSDVNTWVQKGETQASRLQDGFEFHAALRDLKPKDKGTVPLIAFEAGQCEVAYLMIRDKMLEMLEKMKGLTEEQVRSLLKKVVKFKVPVIVGTDGTCVIALDDHHTLSAYLGMLGLAFLTDPGQLLAAVRPQASLYRLFEEVGLSVGIFVEEQAKDLSLEKLWKVHGNRFHLIMQDGSERMTGMRRLGDMQDNMMRYLSAWTRVKTAEKGKEDKKRLRVEVVPNPLWLKLPGAPHQVEFAVGAIFADALRRAGEEYDPTVPMRQDLQSLLRCALLEAKADPEHRYAKKLQGVMVVPTGVDFDNIQDRLHYDLETGVISFSDREPSEIGKEPTPTPISA